MERGENVSPMHNQREERKKIEGKNVGRNLG